MFETIGEAAHYTYVVFLCSILGATLWPGDSDDDGGNNHDNEFERIDLVSFLQFGNLAKLPIRK